MGDARLAQLVERQPFKLVVVGSSPTVGGIWCGPSSESLSVLAWRRAGSHERQCVRVVKESDSKSDGLCPRGFESPRCRFSRWRKFDEKVGTVHSVEGIRRLRPNIAQLVERSTVDDAGIEWSLVRFRVSGFF